MSENESKKVELADSKLDEISGGVKTYPIRTGYRCDKCGRYFGSIEKLQAHAAECKAGQGFTPPA